MKRGIVTAISLFICFLLQTSVFDMIKLADTAPNVMLIFVCSIALMRGQKVGMVAGFFSGLLLDIEYGSILGGFAFLYMFFGFVDGLFNHIYYSDDNFLPLVLVGANDLVYGILMYIVVGLFNNHRNLFTYTGKIILPELVYTVAVSIILYQVLLRLNDWLESHEKGSADYV